MKTSSIHYWQTKQGKTLKISSLNFVIHLQNNRFFRGHDTLKHTTHNFDRDIWNYNIPIKNEWYISTFEPVRLNKTLINKLILCVSS